MNAKVLSSLYLYLFFTYFLTFLRSSQSQRERETFFLPFFHIIFKVAPWFHITAKTFFHFFHVFYQSQSVCFLQKRDILAVKLQWQFLTEIFLPFWQLLATELFKSAVLVMFWQHQKLNWPIRGSHSHTLCKHCNTNWQKSAEWSIVFEKCWFKQRGSTFK